MLDLFFSLGEASVHYTFLKGWAQPWTINFHMFLSCPSAGICRAHWGWFCRGYRCCPCCKWPCHWRSRWASWASWGSWAGWGSSGRRGWIWCWALQPWSSCHWFRFLRCWSSWAAHRAGSWGRKGSFLPWSSGWEWEPCFIAEHLWDWRIEHSSVSTCWVPGRWCWQLWQSWSFHGGASCWDSGGQWGVRGADCSCYSALPAWWLEWWGQQWCRSSSWSCPI